jgi:peptidoglycan/xylan/chitin deacetylase (PgdA/CDA1 family)
MQGSPELYYSTPATKRNGRIAISIVSVLILLSIISAFLFQTSGFNSEPALVVIRVDDIQDFAFREAQLFLLNEGMANQVPLSLAVIAGMFGEDKEVVQTTKLAVSSGSEITAHGWEHENLAKISLTEQKEILSKSMSRIKEILGYDVKALVPPMFGFNQDTITAMQATGYNIMSTLIDYDEPGLVSNVLNLPATVELSHLSKDNWKMKRLYIVKAEIANSIRKYGFAIVVTHPQEFITDKKLNQANVELYRNLLKDLKHNYSFTTLEAMADIKMSYPDNSISLK